jgi:hypothetical protein
MRLASFDPVIARSTPLGARIYPPRARSKRKKRAPDLLERAFSQKKRAPTLLERAFTLQKRAPNEKSEFFGKKDGQEQPDGWHGLPLDRTLPKMASI